MAEKVGQHTHCQICSKAIPITETLCSDECKQRYQALAKRRKMWLYFFYILMFFAIIMLALQLYAR